MTHAMSDISIDELAELLPRAAQNVDHDIAGTQRKV